MIRKRFYERNSYKKVSCWKKWTNMRSMKKNIRSFGHFPWQLFTAQETLIFDVLPHEKKSNFRLSFVFEAFNKTYTYILARQLQGKYSLIFWPLDVTSQYNRHRTLQLRVMVLCQRSHCSLKYFPRN